MGQSRASALSVLNLENHFLFKIDIEEVIDEFAATKNRRVKFLDYCMYIVIKILKYFFYLIYSNYKCKFSIHFLAYPQKSGHAPPLVNYFCFFDSV
jgi:hypothetical protein